MFEGLVKRFVAQPVTDFAPAPQEISSGLWVLDRQVRFPGGFRLPNRTTLLQLRDESLVVISAPPVLGADDRSAIDALGPVGRVIVPNSFHYVFAEAFMSHFSDALLFVPPGFFDRIDTWSIGTEVGPKPPLKWPDDLHYKTLCSVKPISELVFFHPASATLIVTDFAFNMHRFPRAIDGLAWWLSGVPSGFGPGRTARRLLLQDKAVARAFLTDVLRWPFERILFAHGDIIDRDARAQFQQAFEDYLD